MKRKRKLLSAKERQRRVSEGLRLSWKSRREGKAKCQSTQKTTGE
jgi:hypothetical protein